jgi:hypothetical protein
MTITAESPAPVPVPPPERRRSPRFRLRQPVAMNIGRGTGSLIDISATGARVRHTVAVARGAYVRVTFERQGARFEAVAEVLASRVATIAAGQTLYESRIRFLSFSGASSELLERLLADLDDGDLRKWVANLRGWQDEDAHADTAVATEPVSAFVRCRFVNRRWEQRRTRDASIPPDGFIVAAGTDPSEIRALCRIFEQSDAEARKLLQVMACAALER